MHFSKYPNSKAWFQILFWSHWSIQFDLLPKLTHKSVVFFSKITVCFGSPCKSIFHLLENNLRQIWDDISIFLMILQHRKIMSIWIFLSNRYLTKTHFKTNRSGNERAMGSDAQKKQKIRRRKAFNYEITREKNLSRDWILNNEKISKLQEFRSLAWFRFFENTHTAAAVKLSRL